MKVWQRISSTVKTLLMSCREASRAQSELIDHELPASRRLGLRLHLFVCRLCRRYGRQIRFLHDAANHQPERLSEAVPRGLSDGARQRIKQTLTDTR
jgi:hypothetical protein